MALGPLGGPDAAPDKLAGSLKLALYVVALKVLPYQLCDAAASAVARHGCAWRFRSKLVQHSPRNANAPHGALRVRTLSSIKGG